MIKRSTVYGAALAMVLAGSFAVPAQAAMKMVVVGGGSCGQGSSSGSGQISLNDLLSGWAGDRGGAGTGGSGCAAPWSGSLSDNLEFAVQSFLIFLEDFDIIVSESE